MTIKRSGASRRSLRWSKRTATPNAMTPTAIHMASRMKMAHGLP